MGSLTRKLERNGVLSVEVLHDGWAPATLRERRKLNLRPREATRVREVVLYCDGVAVIYARSIVPARSLRGHWRRVPLLGTMPLGGYLFKFPTLKRSKIEITELPIELFPNRPTSVWARRSVFMQYGPGILVNEAFFSTIYDLRD
jgi:chorismate lyase